MFAFIFMKRYGSFRFLDNKGGLSYKTCGVLQTPTDCKRGEC